MSDILVSLKKGVNFSNMHEKIWGAVPKIATVFEGVHVPFVITAGRDGKHKIGSLHYAGRAIDIRSRDLSTDAIKVSVLNDLKRVLGDEYDVLFEGDHYHVEYDPD